MGLFSSILEKLGFGQQAEPSKPTPAPTPIPPRRQPRFKNLPWWPSRRSMSSRNLRVCRGEPAEAQLESQLWICSSSSTWIAASTRERGLRPNSDVPRRRWAILPR